MLARVREVLELLDHARVYREIGRAHDHAREEYRLKLMLVIDASQFQKQVTQYVTHHERAVSGVRLPAEAAFAIATGVLREAFPRGNFLDGYLAALATGMGDSPWNMPAVINALSDGLKTRAIREYVDRVFHHHIDPLSWDDRNLLAAALRDRYGDLLSRLAIGWEQAVGVSSANEMLRLTRQSLHVLLARRIRFNAG